MRHVFFSFHHADILRTVLVRNMWVANKQTTRFTDSANYEKSRRQGQRAIERWIDTQMHGTSVTVVLIGTQTLNRQFVKYEIEQSIARGNGLLGIHINKLEDLNNTIKTERVTSNLDRYNELLRAWGYNIPVSQQYKTKSYTHSPAATPNAYYNWIRNNIGGWVERAALNAGR